MSERRAVVFGANGSIGSELIRQLSGTETIAVVRHGKASDIPVREGLQVVEADISQERDLAAVLEGATVAHITIADFGLGHARPEILRRISPGSGFQRAFETNVVLPSRIHKVAEEQGVERVVWLSSTAVLREGEGKVTDIYAVTKDMSEKALLAVQRRTGVTILRPASVFGPGAETWTETLYQRFSQEKRFIPGRGEGKMPHVDIRDVATAMIKAAETPHAASQVYNLAADESLSLSQIADYYKLLADKSTVLTPAFQVLLLGRILDMYAIMTGKAVPFSHESVKSVLDPTRYIDNQKAKDELGITFRPANETMWDSLLWLNERHDLEKADVIIDFFANR